MKIDKKWKKYEPDENTAKFVVFLMEHYFATGIGLGMAVGGAAYVVAASTGYSLRRMNNGEWWGIFPVLLGMAVLAVTHELIHFAFSNWRQSRFIFVREHCAIAVQVRGEYSKWRYLTCLLAPPVIISSLIVPALRFDSPYLVTMVIVNLCGSGMDWITAVLAITVIKSNQVFLDGKDAYLPVGRND